MNELSSLLDLPGRTAKPRERGLTHVIDAGLSARQAEDLLDVAADHVDILKLGWGTAAVTANLQRKLEVYRSAGIPVVCGGTLLEVAILHDRLDEAISAIEALGLTHVEISDGSIFLPRERKLEIITRLARDFIVLSEVGSKDASVEIADADWARWAREEREAGAWKVITEARESGTVGIYAGDGSVKDELIRGIAAQVPVEDLIFEAPQKAQQVWFLERFGANANLGNIAADDVISLETLRLGLRGDTVQSARSWPRAESVPAAGGSA